jgi:hypothetical protein
VYSSRYNPIVLRIEEAVRRYYLSKGIGDSSTPVDREVEHKHWPHPADNAPVMKIMITKTKI